MKVADNTFLRSSECEWVKEAGVGIMRLECEECEAGVDPFGILLLY